MKYGYGHGPQKPPLHDLKSQILQERPSDPKKIVMERPILGAMEAIDREIEALFLAANALQERLCPVLEVPPGESVPLITCPEVPMSQPSSPMLSTFETKVGQLSAVRKGLESLLERIQI